MFILQAFLMTLGALVLVAVGGFAAMMVIRQRQRRACALNGIDGFIARPLMTRPERRLYSVLHNLVPMHFGENTHILNDVSLGRMLGTCDMLAAIALKPCKFEFVLVDENAHPICAILLTGLAGAEAGEEFDQRCFLGGRAREALESAGVTLIELNRRIDPSEISMKLADVAAHPRPVFGTLRRRTGQRVPA
ncbi:MAG: DUF2726 domain-containing protein [Paracoccaceae bacterium]